MCIRIQSEAIENKEVSTTSKSHINVTDWCQDADDWDDNNSNVPEENGNVINAERISDDDESCSTEESLRAGIGNISFDDRNANVGLGAAAQGINNSKY